MASADNINAGKAVVTISGDTNPLQKAIDESKSKIQAFGEQLQSVGKTTGIVAGVIGGIGAAITAPFAAGLVVLTEAAGGIAQASRRTGMSFEEVQDAAAGFRLSVEDMPAIIAKMSSALVDARDPSSRMARNFAELGLSIEALNSASQAERLDMIADALSNVSDQARRIDLAREILGRGGLAVNFSGGADGIRARQARNRELGGVISNEDIQAALAYSRAQSELKIATVGLSRVLGAVFAPIAKAIAEYILSIVLSIREWVDNNRTLLTIIGYIGAALGVIGAALALDAARIMFLGKAIEFVASRYAAMTAASAAASASGTVAVAGVWTRIGATVTSAWAGIGIAIAKVGGIIATAFASAAFWPAVLAIGAIVAVVYAAYSIIQSWPPALTIIKTGFWVIWQGVLAAWNAIVGVVSAVARFVFVVLKLAVAIWAIVSAAIVLPILVAVMTAAAAVGYVAYQAYRLLAAALGYLWGIVVRVYTAIADFVMGLIRSIDWISVLTGLLIAAAPILAYIFLPVIAAIVLLIGAYKLAMFAVNKVWEFTIKAWAAIAEFAAMVADAAVTAWDRITDAIGDAIEWIVGFIDSTMFGLISVWRVVWDSFVRVVMSAFGWVIEAAMAVFGELRNIVSGGVDAVTAIVGDMGIAFGAIGDFISVGDWASAFDVAMIALRLAWERTKNWLIDSWYRVTFIFGSAWDSVVNSLYSVLRPVVVSIINLLYGLVEGIQGALNSVIRGINEAIMTLPEILRPALVGEVNLAGDGRAAAIALANEALGRQAPRQQAVADRGVQEGLEAELEARRRQAELAAWVAAGPPDEWELGAANTMASALQFGSGLGSFSASALGQIGATNYAERTAVAVEAMVGGVRRVGDLLENDDGGVVAS